MEIRVDSQAWEAVNADWLIVPLSDSSELAAQLKHLDEILDGQIVRLREAGDLSGKLAETVAVRDCPSLAAKRLLFVGLGADDDLDVRRLRKAFQTAARKVSDKPDVRIAVGVPDVGRLSPDVTVSNLVAALTVGCVGQDLYQSDPGRHPFSEVQLLVGDSANLADATRWSERGTILGDAVNLTRELVNRTAGEIYPESFADRAAAEAESCGLACRILNEQELEAERMGALLAVAVGSDRPPRVVVLEHRGGTKESPTIALVGKGVTFDSGGLSLKPSEGMKTMKCDMAGAATVLGAMTAIARLQLPVNVVGYLGLVENMVSGRSYKLGDVLTARNGVSIEVLNTDAEGRLVLADVLSYAADQGADRIVDLATLTGACVVALGEQTTGVFTNQQDWCDAVLTAARECGEQAWQMPMFNEFADLLKSDVADCKNVGPRWGGAITAAKFLEKFVDEKPWVHLDIAGPSFASSNKPHREGGGSGCMVRTLIALAENVGESAS